MIEPSNPGFGLYIHWPFCQSKCPYCDFNSHVAGRVDQKRWQDAYIAEIDRAGCETGGQVLQSVFFGGGTPSLMDPALVAAILERVRATWPMSNDPEITLEANPTSVEAGRFAAYRQAGVNRVSVGVQALNDDALRLLGRMHSAEEAVRAVEIALTDHDAAFIIVHVLLGIISIVLAILAWRATMPPSWDSPSPSSKSPPLTTG